MLIHAKCQMLFSGENKLKRISISRLLNLPTAWYMFKNDLEITDIRVNKMNVFLHRSSLLQNRSKVPCFIQSIGTDITVNSVELG